MSDDVVMRVRASAPALSATVLLAAVRWALIAGGVVLVLIGVWVLLGRVRCPVTSSGGVDADGPSRAGPVTSSFARLEAALAGGGAPRGSAETGAELLARTTDLRRRSAGRALEAFEQERYGERPPHPSDAAEAVVELDRLTAEKVDGNKMAAP